jgi:hypothetical protein
MCTIRLPHALFQISEKILTRLFSQIVEKQQSNNTFLKFVNRLLLPEFSYNARSVRSGIIVHKDQPVSQRMIIKLRHNSGIKHVVTVCNSTEVFQGPAMSLDMNPIEHVWDFIGLAVKLTNIIHNVKILLN